MANLCDNQILISGLKENMKFIHEFFSPLVTIKVNGEISPLVMSTLVPHDEEYEQIVQSKNYLLTPETVFYGTKWDFNLEDVDISDITEESVSFFVSTPWSPPEAFCKKLAKKYDVTVHIYYDEPGIGFIGETTFYSNGDQNGEHYDNYLKGLYNIDNERFWHEITYRVLDCKEPKENIIKECSYLDSDKLAELNEFLDDLTNE